MHTNSAVQEQINEQMSQFSSDDSDNIIEQFRNVPPVYAGNARLLKWGHTSSTGMWLTVTLLDAEEFEPHPFKGLRAARGSTTEGRRLRLVLQEYISDDEDVRETIYSHEALLVWWGEDCADGMKLTVKLDETVDGANMVHPCESMETGKRTGEVLSLVCWALDDQELPQWQGRKRRKFRDLPHTTQTQLMTRNPIFYSWLRTEVPAFVTEESQLQVLREIVNTNHELFCERAIKMWCQIDSRSEFNDRTDSAKEARNRWNYMYNRFQDRGRN